MVTRQVAVADRGQDIQQAVREALGRADLIITTGGLGPTSDDITRELIAELLGRKLIKNREVEAHIEAFFAKRGWPRPARTDAETMVPEGALVFLNATGTAPVVCPCGFPGRRRATNGSSCCRGRRAAPMFDTAVAPLIRREFAAEIFVCRTLRTTGVGESRVQELIEAGLAPLVQQGMEVGYCARPRAVDVRLTATGSRAESLVRHRCRPHASAPGAADGAKGDLLDLRHFCQGNLVPGKKHAGNSGEALPVGLQPCGVAGGHGGADPVVRHIRHERHQDPEECEKAQADGRFREDLA